MTEVLWKDSAVIEKSSMSHSTSGLFCVAELLGAGTVEPAVRTSLDSILQHDV